MSNIKEIGIVRSKYKVPSNAVEMREAECKIAIKPEYLDGLYRIEECEYLDIVFNFHKSDNFKLKLTNRFGEYKGIFATRASMRPSGIGLTRVKLLDLKGNILLVKGLDAINGTPVLDIKPIDNGIMSNERYDEEIINLKQSPRNRIISLVKNKKIDELIALSGMLHGHYCPGLSMGVVGSIYALNKMHETSDGMESLLAITEINSCITDGIQFVTGCTLGNNSLIFRDFGKSAFSLVQRDGIGFRMSVHNDFRDRLKEQNPEFMKLYQIVVKEQNRNEEILNKFKLAAKKACFNIANWNVEDIFKFCEVKLTVPEYAPVRESLNCSKCNEEIMSGKAVNKNNSVYCRSCAEVSFLQLDGFGISENCNI